MEECRCDPAIGRILRLMTKKEEREARKLEKLRLEKERMYEMFSFEREYGDHQAICGIDEVGRGPFAGPVVAAAVILPKNPYAACIQANIQDQIFLLCSFYLLLVSE